MSVHAKKMQLKVSDGGSLNGDILKNGNNEYLIDEEKEPYRFKAKQMDHSSKKDINQMNLSLMIPPPSSHQRTSEISPRESTLKRFLDEKVPLLPIRLMEDSNEVDLLKSAENLLQNFFPSSRHNTTFDWTPCNDGITNKLLKCRMKKVEEETTNEKQNEVSEKTVLVKIYGKKSEFFIDRDKELLVIYQGNM